MIEQRELHRLEGQFSKFQVTQLALTNFANRLRIAAFDFRRVGVFKPRLHLSTAGPVFPSAVMGADFLKTQRATAEEFVLPEFFKATSVKFHPQPAALFDMGKYQKEIFMVAFQLANRVDERERARGSYCATKAESDCINIVDEYRTFGVTLGNEVESRLVPWCEAQKRKYAATYPDR